MSSNPQTSSGPAPASRTPFELPSQPMGTIAIVLIAIGVVGFFLALVAGGAARAWQAYLVNLLFWMGIAQAGVVCSAAFYLTQGRWAGRTHFRLAEAFSNFIILGFILFWPLYFGRNLIFPWIAHPVPALSGWLNVPFLFARDGIALAIITVVSFAFLRISRSPEAAAWALDRDSIAMPPRAIRRLAPALGMCYVAVYSLLAFDLVMSLSPLWHSTLFGWFFFAGAFWSAIVMMTVTAVHLRRILGPGNVFENRRVLHDLGKLVFGFSIFWVYTMFAQFLVIWYGDLPLESFFIAIRVYYRPWPWLSWTVLGLVWAVPFVVLLGKAGKRNPMVLGTVATIGLIGFWLERYVLIVPSLSPGRIPLGMIELAVTAGFAGAFYLCAYPGLRRIAQAATTDTVGE